MKAAAEKAAAEKAAAMKAAAEKAAAEKAAAEKAAAMKAAAEKAAAEKAAAMKAAAEKAAAEKAVAEKAAAMKAAAEKAAAEKAAAEKAAAEKAAVEKAAAEKAAAEKAAAEKVAAEKAAAEKAAAELAAAEQAKADMAKESLELDKRLKELIVEGNAKLNAGDIQGARAIKKEIGKVREDIARLSAAGVTLKNDQPAPKADNSNTANGFSSAELQNYRHTLDSWEQERNEALAQDGVDRKKVLEDYRQRLVAYGDALLVTNNIEGASAAKDAITTITLDLDELK